MNLKFKVDLVAKAKTANERAARATFQVLNARFQQAIATPAFPFEVDRKDGGNTTVRSNGQVVGSPRNIVDTGNLRQSNTGPRINGMRAVYTWATPYATAAHEGAAIDRADGGVTLVPARPWTGAVLGTDPVSGIPVLDVGGEFLARWQKAIRS